jgi:hypothetical protein
LLGTPFELWGVEMPAAQFDLTAAVLEASLNPLGKFSPS